MFREIIMQKLECAVQNYAWGRIGEDSFVARLLGAMRGAAADPKRPYAELWMGTHPNGPSALFGDKSKKLGDYIKANPSLLAAHEQGQINFLFKILSVGKALSVQSHPTKDQAMTLHARDPTNYPDDNHKPEMAIALTDFEMLCGFRLPHEIDSNIKGSLPKASEQLGEKWRDQLYYLAHDELLSLVNEHDLEKLLHVHQGEAAKNSLKALFSAIWKSPPEIIAKVVREIVERIAAKTEKAEIDQLMLRLNEQYPGGDVGVLAPLFLNHFTLKPGESTYLGPNEPHAYLSGDCVECMACSDNTIRAGLTPKFKDVETLCLNLTYSMSPAPYFRPKEVAAGVLEYAPPVNEFCVHALNENATALCALGASSILIVVHGGASIETENAETSVTEGDVVFIPHTESGKIRNSSADFLAYRAFTPPPHA